VIDLLKTLHCQWVEIIQVAMLLIYVQETLRLTLLFISHLIGMLRKNKNLLWLLFLLNFNRSLCLDVN